MTTRVLCIEDEPEMIELIRLILARGGYEVLGAESGLDALELLATTPDIDLILLDLMMPEMDGWEVYQRLKADERTRDIPVIVVTAKAQRIDRVLGLYIVGVDDYITKPFSPKMLLESVKQILERKKGNGAQNSTSHSPPEADKSPQTPSESA
ncbi:MAG TPA: response regulator [Chloroflexi bacterium]|nr:response regulator [Chloroflexota bacterium]